MRSGKQLRLREAARGRSRYGEGLAWGRTTRSISALTSSSMETTDLALGTGIWNSSQVNVVRPMMLITSPSSLASISRARGTVIPRISNCPVPEPVATSPLVNSSGRAPTSPAVKVADLWLPNICVRTYLSLYC